MTAQADTNGARPDEMTLSRTFEAPRDLLFTLWTDPRHVSKWWGIKGSTITLCEIDLRVGGRWTIHMKTPQGDVYPNDYVFTEIVENERLVFEDLPKASAEKTDAPSQPAVHWVVFEGDADRTTVSLRTRFASAEDRDRAISFGMQRGIEQSLDHLEKLVTAMTSASH